MEYRDIAIGIVIGILIGAAGVFLVNQSKISKLNREADDLREEGVLLNEALDAMQVQLDAQEEALEAAEALQDEVEAQELVIQGYEAYKESAESLIAELTVDVNTLNILYASQVYRAEEALTLLHDYLSEYESKINFASVYGDLSFEEWWEINGGPAEVWLSLVYG
jgi:gas vesicle protein